MKMSKIKKALKENKLTKGVYKALSNIYNYKYKIMSDEKFAKTKYEKRMGLKLDLDNPKTFDDKIWWLKINYHNPFLGKYKVLQSDKEYPKRALCALL